MGKSELEEKISARPQDVSAAGLVHDATLEPPAERPERKRARRIGSWLAYGLIAILLVFFSIGLINTFNNPVESGMAPDFTLTTFDGQTITLSELRGQVVVINFWASWCPPCREEAPYLEQTWRKYKDQGVVFIGVDYVDTEREALAYIAEFDITYFNGPDIGTRISDNYHIKGVPETFFVAKNGELRGNNIGPLSPPKLDEKIDEMLAEEYQP